MERYPSKTHLPTQPSSIRLWLTIFLIGLFPFGDSTFKILRGVSVSFFHRFERSQSHLFSLPDLFDKYIQFSVAECLVIGLFISWCVYNKPLIKHFVWGPRSRFLTLYTGFAIFSIASSLFAEYFFQYTTILSLYIGFITFILIDSVIDNKSHWITKSFWVFITGATVQSLIAIAQYIQQKSIGLSLLSEREVSPFMHNIAVYPLTQSIKNGWLSKYLSLTTDQSLLLRAYGTFDHPNILAAYLMIALLINFFLFTTTKSKYSRIYVGISIVLNILAIALTFSRASIFILALISFSLAIIAFFNKQPYRYPLSIIIMSSILAIGICLHPHLKSRGGIINHNSLSSASNNERLELYQLASDMIRNHPVKGIGHNNFAIYPYSKIHPQYKNTNPTGTLTHNLYLQIASETGLVGLSLYILFTLSIIIPVFRQPLTPLSITLLSCLISLLMIGCFDHFLWAYRSGRFLLFVICGLLSAYTKTRASSEESSHFKYESISAKE